MALSAPFDPPHGDPYEPTGSRQVSIGSHRGWISTEGSRPAGSTSTSRSNCSFRGRNREGPRRGSGRPLGVVARGSRLDRAVFVARRMATELGLVRH